MISIIVEFPVDGYSRNEMNHSVEGLYPFLMKKGAFLRHNEQILSFIDLSFSFFAEIFQ